MWRKKGHLKVAEKNRKWRKKILELAGDQSQNMVTMGKTQHSGIDSQDRIC